MHKIENKNLSRLLNQMRFTPYKKRANQLQATERLLSIIEEDKEYSFEFICYKITEFRIKDELGQQMCKGDQLTGDLRIFIAKLSGQLAEEVSKQDEKIYTIEELAKKLEVSTKTINRWRNKGLSARKYIFADGKKRFGFSDSAIENFHSKNPQLVENASNFKKLTEKQKHKITELARHLVRDNHQTSRHQIIEQIVDKTSHAHETIRYTLINYENTHPDKPIFSRAAGVIKPEQAAELYRSHKKGVTIKELMSQFNRSKSSIYRIINQRRAKTLLAHKIEFIASDEFAATDAYEKILSQKIDIAQQTTSNSPTLKQLSAGSLSKYLESIEKIELFNRDRELELFRRYNYLKYLADLNKNDISLQHAPGNKLKLIEDYLQRSEAIKNIIIEANLRLVVSIANKHIHRGANMLDLVSEGNFALMKAVEKFDYTRGFRFATYCSWIIAKDFARKIPAEITRPDKATYDSMSDIQQDMRTKTIPGVEAVERAHRSLAQVIKDNLNEREQYIILNHFGLLGSLVKKEKKTLKEIGDHLELTKERVRQIELIALQKLRQSLSVEEFELLTG